MSAWLTVARLAAGANVVVLLVLGSVWLRRYREHGASHTFGFLTIGAFLLIENLLWLYFYVLDPVFVGWFQGTTTGAQIGMTLLCGLELIALLVLARLTLV
ncbi:MAG: hypothetical protein ABEJ89_00205 [Haloarculaceae archaeon]